MIKLRNLEEIYEEEFEKQRKIDEKKSIEELNEELGYDYI